MPELHDLLERRARGYEPRPDLLERVVHRRRGRDLKRRVVAGLAAAAIVAAVVLGAWSALRVPSPRPAGQPAPTAPQPSGQGDVSTGQMEIVRQVVDAANARDADLLASSFTDEGTFSPYVEWGVPPLVEVIPAWMDNLEAWDLEVRVRSCEPQTESVVRCDVRTLWHTLQMELGEEWRFEFEHGALKSLVMVRSDLDPDDRSLPLSYTDLDGWESWLEANQPAQAARLLETPLIGGFFPYDTMFAEEIKASIREYLESR